MCIRDSPDTVACFANEPQYTSKYRFPVGPLEAAYDEHAGYFTQYIYEDVLADMAVDFYRDSVKIFLNDEPYTGSQGSLGLGYDAENDKETSTLSFVPRGIGAWKIMYFYNAYGVKYTFIFTFNTVKNNARIAPIETYVTVDNPETKNYSVEAIGDYDANNKYYLVDQDIKNYLKVINHYNVEGLNMDLRVDPNAAGVDPQSYTNRYFTHIPNAEDSDCVLTNSTPFQWGTYKMRKFDVYALLQLNSTQETIDSATVTIWTADPIPVFEGGNATVAEHDADKFTYAYILDGLDIRDLKDTVLVADNKLRPVGPADGQVPDYGQSLTIGAPVIISGPANIEEINFDTSSFRTSVLILKQEQGTIVNPIVLEVPVTLKYTLDNNEGKTVKVRVTFQQKQ